MTSKLYLQLHAAIGKGNYKLNINLCRRKSK
jgi:hypothetical protein